MRRERKLGSAGEDTVQLLLDLALLGLGGHGDLLDQQGACGVEHLALAERQLLVGLEPLEVAQDLGDLEHGAGLDLLHVLPVAAVSRLGPPPQPPPPLGLEEPPAPPPPAGGAAARGAPPL